MFGFIIPLSYSISQPFTSIPKDASIVTLSSGWRVCVSVGGSRRRLEATDCLWTGVGWFEGVRIFWVYFLVLEFEPMKI